MPGIISETRFALALWIGKATQAAMRALGRNATYLPGVVALKICPGFLARVGKPETVIAVTGTNGKTTVCNLIIDMLTRAGVSVLDNRLGSNTASGIAASLLGGCSLTGKRRYGVAVFETDERSSHRLFPFIRPNILVITNLFRDSIMRNAHPEYIAGIIDSALTDGTKLILNCDDLISARIAPRLERAYFGIARMAGDVTQCVNRINDMRLCPECGAELAYEYRRYHHIGFARCPGCGFESPAPDYGARKVDFSSMTASVRDAGGESLYELLSDSVFNVYNQLTAIAVMRELGYSHGEIHEAIEGVEIIKSRYSEERAGKISIVMQMAKDRNALACSRAFDYVSQRPGDKEIILMMNNLSDSKKWSENVCWLYDCDFEFLNRDDITRIVASGPRARDYRYRLLLAGVPEDRLRFTDDERDAPAELVYSAGESVYILYGTDAIALARDVRDGVRRRAEVMEPY
jgi:UDP-N-acetylmuramyl tripeptide synthase